MISLLLRYVGILCLIIVTTAVQAKDSMNWSVIHWPPLMILEGDDAGKGRYNFFMERFQQEMPQYTHDTLELNWKRVWSDLRAGNEICNIMSLKTADREEFVLFSEPHSISLPTRIIMRASTHDQLSQPEKLALTELINNPELRGEVETARSYSAEIDAILDQRAQDSNIKERTTDSVNLLRMLLYKRFDYMIEYPYIVEYFYRAIPQPPEAIRSVAIEEMAPFFSIYLACPKTDWGTERIAAFNDALKRMRHSEEYQTIMQMWYGNEREKKVIREGYKKMIDSE